MTFHGSQLRSGPWRPPVLGSSETVLSRLSQASLGSESPTFSPLQSQIDGLVTHFVDEAANPRTLAALTAGGLAYRFGRIGVLGMGSSQALRPLSVALGLGSEVTAFELANRSLTALSGDSSNPNLWRWGGRGGWGQGLASSAITFGILKGAGYLGREQNIIFQHAFQSTAMVASHQTAGLLGMMERPEGSLAEQFLHAEATNLQLGAGTSLLHSMAPGLHSLERGLDLSLRSGESPFSYSRFLSSPWIEAEAAAEGEGASSSGDLRDPNLLMVGNGEGDGPSDGDKPSSGSTPPSTGEKKPGSSVPTELTHGETLPSVPPKGEERLREAPAQIARSPMAETLGPPEAPDPSSDQASLPPEEGGSSDDKYVDPSEHARFLQKALHPTTPPPPPKIQPGIELEGRFLIKRSLGAGGFGEVWLAQDKVVGRQVAIKVLRSERLRQGNQSLTEKYIKRFEREMRIVGQLGTRYFPSLHEIYRMKDGRTLFVMEYLSGTSLGNLRSGLSQKNSEILARFPPEKRMEIFEEICEALEWAHLRGFVHMDLKPDNIFITAEKNSEGSEKIGVKVLDWGQANGVAELLQKGPLAKEDRISLPDLEAFQENLTKDGAVSGTPGYIAPEMFLKDELENPRSPDIFDLGVILYEWMTGVHPYANFIRGDTSEGEANLVPVIDKGLTLINQISTAPGMRKLIHFSKVMTGQVPWYFQEMEKIAFKAMSQEPIERYKTAYEMMLEVRAVREKMLAERELVVRAEAEMVELYGLRQRMKELEVRMLEESRRFSIREQLQPGQWSRMRRPQRMLKDLRDAWRLKVEEIVRPLDIGISTYGPLTRPQEIIAELSLLRLMHGGDLLSEADRTFLINRIQSNDPTGKYSAVLTGSLPIRLAAADFESGQPLQEGIHLRIIPLEREKDDEGHDTGNYRAAAPRLEGNLKDLSEQLKLPAGYYVFELSHPDYATMKVPLHLRLKDVREGLFHKGSFDLSLEFFPRSRVPEGMVVVHRGIATIGHDFFHEGSPYNVYSVPMEKRPFEHFFIDRRPRTQGDYARFIEDRLESLNRLIHDRDEIEARKLIGEIRELLPQARFGPRDSNLTSLIQQVPLESAFEGGNFYWEIKPDAEAMELRFQLSIPEKDPHGYPQFAEQPIHVINGDSALAYARWLSEKEGRAEEESYELISADQKEIVARSSLPWYFPWGYEDDPSFVASRLTLQNPMKGTYPQAVGTHALGEGNYRDHSLYGNEEGPVVDLLGNVIEFTSTEAEPGTLYISGGGIRRAFGALFSPAARSYVGKSTWAEDCFGGMRLVINPKRKNPNETK